MPRLKGFKHSEEAKQKMRFARLGKKFSPLSPETKKKISEYQKNNREKSHLWKGGITPLNKVIRHCFKYRQWISDIFTRDDWTCQECRKRGGKLHTHHIKSFSKILEENKIKIIEDALVCEELWNINNGITYCIDCHKLTENFGRKLKIG